MRALQALIISIAVAGCAAERLEPLATDQQGVAELRIDPGPRFTQVSRVSVTSDGTMLDLPFNGATGTFDGTMFLPTGSHTLVAQAFFGTTLVGESSPVSVEIGRAHV